MANIAILAPFEYFVDKTGRKPAAELPNECPGAAQVFEIAADGPFRVCQRTRHLHHLRDQRPVAPFPAPVRTGRGPLLFS